jgi:hypothetical protein
MALSLVLMSIATMDGIFCVVWCAWWKKIDYEKQFVEIGFSAY